MLPIIFDAKEQDCSAAGPNHEIKMCEIGPRASYKMTHCICLGDPKDPLMVQTSFFAIPKIGFRHTTAFCLKKAVFLEKIYYRYPNER